MLTPARKGQGTPVDNPSKTTLNGERAPLRRKAELYCQNKGEDVRIQNISCPGEVLELGVGEHCGLIEGTYPVYSKYLLF